MRLKTLLAAAISIHLAATAAPAQDQDLAAYLGPLAPSVTLGQDGVWSYSISDGWFNMVNGSDPERIRYFYIKRDPVAPGRIRTVRALTAVRGQGDGFTASGLFFNARGDLGGSGDKSYFVLAITPDGKAKILLRNMDGSFKDATAEKIRARSDGSDVLEIRETSTDLVLLVNGQKAFTLSNENGFSPVYGILGTGTGRMAFTGFQISEQ